MSASEQPRRVPGPRGHFLLGSMFDFRDDILQALLDGWREYGDAVHFRGPLTIYLFVHPDHAQHILQGNHLNYRHPDFEIERLRPTFGEGLVTSQGDFWRRQRRLAQPAFHRQRIAAFATLMTDATAKALDDWQAHADRGTAFDIKPELTQLTLDILAKALFSTGLEGDDLAAFGRAVTVANEHTNRQFLSPINLQRLPLPANRRFREAVEVFDAITYRLIGERRRSGEETGDLLSMLLAARDEETGEGMSDRQLHDEVLTILLTGHETVSTALAWAWYLLAKQPEATRRLQAEVETVLAGRTPTLDDIPRLTYTTMILQESLRLYPPVWVAPRTALQDDVVGGYRLPAGPMVFVVPYITHRHPMFWENPEAFDPERFTPERSAGRHRYAYIPFGAGPRQCIGNNFAMLEMQLILAMMAQRYRPVLEPGRPLALQPMITLRARDGISVVLEPLPKRDAALAST